jgi:hypothetical protein
MARSAGKKTTSKTVVEKKSYLCPYCGKTKKEDDFYVSTDPRVITGRTSMCKDCVQKIAFNWDENRQEMGTPTKKSIMDALEYIDRPFLESLWNSSYHEWLNPDAKRKRKSIWDTYIKNVSMINYNGMRWRDGDIFNTYIEDAKQIANMEVQQEASINILSNSEEVNDEFEKNKNSVIRLLGYDPFLSEKPEDQPLLYSQLIGYLDAGGDGNEDMMRTSSAITIVRGFLQQAKLDDKLAKVMANTSANPTEMKTLLDAKKNLSATISQLAEQSCLSLKHNKNASKGENTWTGKIKKLKDMDLREAEVNGFDIGTCRGMQQVLEISDASIMKQLALDESEWSEIVADQRKLLVDTQRERDIYKEINRVLLRENLDLRDTLEENNMLDEDNLHNLKDLFSPFGETTTQDEEDEENE